MTRFAKSTKHLVEALHTFKHLNINFISFNENIDTGSPLGEAIFTIISAMSQLERDIIKERVIKVDSEEPKKKGKQLGRPKTSSKSHSQAKDMRLSGLSTRQIADKLNVSKSVIGRALKGCPENPLELVA